jgi:hypothetical protein
MRTPIASDLMSRDGTLQKDAGTKNAVIEVQGEESAVLKRPGLIDAMFDFTTPIQGFASLSDIIGGTKKKFGSASEIFDDIATLIFTIGGDSYQITDSMPLYSPTKAYATGAFVFITADNAVPGETEPGEMYFAMGDINPANPRHRPNAAGGINESRGKMWSKTPPTADRYQGVCSGYAGQVCATPEAAGYSAVLAWPYNSRANRNTSTDGWGTFSSATVGGSGLLVQQWTYQGWTGNDANFGISPYGSITKVA